MSSFTQINYDQNLGDIKCNLCGRDFSANSTIFILNNNFAYICERCYIKFPAEDIEEFLNLFDIYGGHFGKLRNNKISLEDIINELFSILNYKKDADVIETNMRLRHKALLYGFSPEYLIEKMKEMIFKK